MENCNRTTNNKYFGCPPRMSDGRHFTDYRSHNYVNDLIQQSNQTKSNYEYRQFLTHNALNIMKMNNDYMNKMNGCTECNATQIPFKTECKINQNYSNCYLKDNNGIGIYNLTEPIMNNKNSVKLSNIKKETYGTPLNPETPGYTPYTPLFSSYDSCK